MADEATPAALPAPADDGVLYVLDASGYVFRAYHAIPPLSTSKGEPTHAVHGFANMLLRLIKEQAPRRLVVALDLPGPSFRKDVFEGYKANRPPTPPDLRQQLERCLQLLDAYEVPQLSAERAEADDVIATVVRRARAAGLRVVIVASDKDLLQLVGDGVVMYDTMRGRVFGPRETREKMGVAPGQVRDLLALTGDSSDNVPGVPKVGPKTAQKLLAEHGDLEGIYAHLDQVSAKGLRARLAEHEASARLSQKLVTLVDDLPLELDLEATRWTGGDPEKLRALFAELEMSRLLADLQPAAAPVVAGALRVVSDLEELRALSSVAQRAGSLALFCAVDGDAPLTGELVGLGLCVADEESLYVPFAHRTLGAPPQVQAADGLAALRPALEDPAVGKLSADLKRDEVALGRHGVALAGGAFDTTIASYLLDAGKRSHAIEPLAHEELGRELPTYDQVTEKRRGKQLGLVDVEVERGCAYAASRAAAVRALSPILRARVDEQGFGALMDDVEIPLAGVLGDLEATGVLVDVEHLRAMSREVELRLRQLETRCHELVGHEFNVASPRQLESILFDELGLRVVKRTKTARSTDHEVLEELAPEHPLPAVILEHRLLAKLKGTYLDALPRQVDARTGRVHTVYNQAVAATGRLSSSDPNLQNIPIRSDVGRKIRDAFVAREGWRILSADYSQIELRVLAHLSGDAELLAAFRADEDVHVRTATAIFGVDPQEVTREQRDQSKTVNYAVIYGQSHFALARNLGIERAQAQQYIDAFFERYAGVRDFMERTVEEARRTGAVRTLLGRRRTLADLGSKNRALRQGAERTARNTPIQGSAADIMKIAMVQVHRGMHEAGMAAKMLLTVHDELVFEAPPEEEDALEALVRDRMEHGVALDVPLVVDHGWGRSWGQAH